jgi:membrane associated rhomboid family serine protease
MITFIIIGITAIVSIQAFSNSQLFSALLFDPWKVRHQHQWYRMFSHGLLHADWTHLAVNMFVLFSFGQGVEAYFSQLADNGAIRYPWLWFLFLYISALFVSSLPTLRKHGNDTMYSAVGASGAVAAVMSCCIFFNPWSKLLFWAFIPVPGIVFAALYIVYSSYMSRRQTGEPVNHDAHLFGTLYGLLFPLLINTRLGGYFIRELLNFNW